MVENYLVAFTVVNYKLFASICRDALITAGINCFTSFIAGFVVFSVLGYMSFKQDKNIDEVAEHGGLIFILHFLQFTLKLHKLKVTR